jgi:hypothetical protein
LQVNQLRAVSSPLPVLVVFIRPIGRAIAQRLPGRDRIETDPAEGWVRERTLYDLFDDPRGGSSGGTDTAGYRRTR